MNVNQVNGKLFSALNWFGPQVGLQSRTATTPVNTQFGVRYDRKKQTEALVAGNTQERMRAIMSKEARADELIEEQQIQPAIELRRQALAEHIQLFGPNHETVSDRRLLLGLWHMQAGEYALAEEQYQQAISVSQAASEQKVNDTEVPRLYRQLADVYVAQGQWPKAEATLKKALEAYQATVGNDHVFTAVCRSELADVLQAQKKADAAENEYILAIVGMTKAFPPDETVLLETKDKLGMLYMSQGQFKGALGIYQALREELETQYGLGAPQTLTALKKVVHVQMEAESWESAETTLKEIIQISDKHFGKGDIDTVEAKNDLAVVLAQQEKLDEAHQILLDVRREMKALSSKHPAAAVDALVNLSRTYSLTGNGEMAEVMWNEAEALCKKHQLPALKHDSDD